MATTRSRTRNQNRDAPNKRSKISDDGLATWSNLNHDLLFLIMMQLGLVDYLAFSGVCKSWRSFAHSNRNEFMVSRQPLLLFMSTRSKRNCYLDDYLGRKFKTILPKAAGSVCVGISCGYLIMFKRKTKDFLLVNPITRHELHFPSFPFNVNTNNPALVRAILVFSPKLSGWVFVIALRFSRTILFCLSGEPCCWNHVNSDFPICDIQAFKGKIYTINAGCFLCEMRLDPNPKLIAIVLKDRPKLYCTHAEFVSSSENLYVMDRVAADVYMTREVDFNKKQWKCPKETIGEYAVFLGNWKCGVAIKPETWADAQVPFRRSAYFMKTDSTEKGLTPEMLYFPHDCFNVHLLK